MRNFLETTHLSEILEKSQNEKIIIFKYSNNCGSSARLKKEFEEKFNDKKFNSLIFLVTVQTQPVLSSKISEWFGIQHETPQVIVLEKGKVSHTAHHRKIDLKDFI